MSDLNMESTYKTNWDYIDSLTDDQIDYSDIPPLRDDFFDNATIRRPAAKKMVLVEVDKDTLDWYESQGERRGETLKQALKKYALETKNLKRSA